MDELGRMNDPKWRFNIWVNLITEWDSFKDRVEYGEPERVAAMLDGTDISDEDRLIFIRVAELHRNQHEADQLDGAPEEERQQIMNHIADRRRLLRTYCRENGTFDGFRDGFTREYFSGKYD